MFVENKADGESQNATTRANLLKAAAILERHGHMQRDFADGHGRICMAEAITRAILGKDLSDVSYWHAMSSKDSIKFGQRPEYRAFGSEPSSICVYNNSHTKDECVAFIRETANSIAG